MYLPIEWGVHLPIVLVQKYANVHYTIFTEVCCEEKKQGYVVGWGAGHVHPPAGSAKQNMCSYVIVRNVHD